MRKGIYLIVLIFIFHACCNKKDSVKNLSVKEKSFFIFEDADSVEWINLLNDNHFIKKGMTECGVFSGKDMLTGCKVTEPERCLFTSGNLYDSIPFGFDFKLSADKSMKVYFEELIFDSDYHVINQITKFNFQNSFDVDMLPFKDSLNIAGKEYKNLYLIANEGDSVALYISPEEKIMYYENTGKNEKYLFRPITK